MPPCRLQEPNMWHPHYPHPHLIHIMLEYKSVVCFLLSLFLVCSSPASTPSGITRLQFTAPCSAGSERPGASPISSWGPCTHCRDKQPPQPRATLSKLRPLPPCDAVRLHLLTQWWVHPETGGSWNVTELCTDSWGTEMFLFFFSGASHWQPSCNKHWSSTEHALFNCCEQKSRWSFVFVTKHGVQCALWTVLKSSRSEPNLHRALWYRFKRSSWNLFPSELKTGRVVSWPLHRSSSPLTPLELLLLNLNFI